MPKVQEILDRTDQTIQKSYESLRVCQQGRTEIQAQVEATRKTIEDSMTKLRTPDGLSTQNNESP